MTQPKDEDVETRAIDMAHSDKLEWVKRPRREGQPDTPDAATNAERDTYRQNARDDLDREAEPPTKP